MDLMTDEELDGYSVLILFIVKKKKLLALKKIQRNMGKWNIQKESNVRTLQFSTWTANREQGVLFRVGFSNDIFTEISKLYK